MNTVLFRSEDVVEIVRYVGLDGFMDLAIDRIEKACEEYDQDSFNAPPRNGFSYEDPVRGLVEWMPAIRYGHTVVMKMVGYHPQNPGSRSLPTILSTAMIFDTGSGHLKSVVDASFLTSLRTGAASAVASRILATSESSTIGLIGAGLQAVTQLHALTRIFPVDRVLLSDVDSGACDSFAARAANAGLYDIHIRTTTVEEVVQRADILCTATSIDVGCGPLFDDRGLSGSIHVNAVGSDLPGKTELPRSLLKRSLVCPDFREQAIREGECQQLDEYEIGPDLVTLVKGKSGYRQFRQSPTVFDSTGWALEDYVVAELITGIGENIGCGVPFELATVSADPKDPYGFIAASSAGLRVRSANAG